MSRGTSAVAQVRSERLCWWLAMVLFTGLASAWAVATPPFDGPDESAHVLRAYTVVNGDLVNPPSTVKPGAYTVRVPRAFIQEEFRYPACLIGKPDATPRCLPGLQAESGDADYISSAGRYPPLYYALVGWPIELWPSMRGLYAARLMSALVGGMLLASAAASAFRSRHRTWLLAGLTVAVTPQVLFTNGVVNPSALEISGAASLWATGILVLTERDRQVPARLLARLGVAAVALVSAKASGPLYLALVVAVLLIIAQPGRLRAVLRGGLAWVWVAVVGAATAAGCAWTLLVGPNELGAGLGLPEEFTTARIWRTSIGSWDSWARQMVGNFGWNDIPAPQYTHYVWYMLVGALLMACFAVARRRTALAVGVALLVTLVVPIVLSSIVARKIGFFYQGRYTLPLAVGVPLLASFGVSERLPTWSGARRGLTLVAVLAAIGHFAAFSHVLHRFTQGQSGPLLYFVDPDWSPPLQPAVLLLALIVLLVAQVLLLRRAAVGAPAGTSGYEQGRERRIEAHPDVQDIPAHAVTRPPRPPAPKAGQPR